MEGNSIFSNDLDEFITFLLFKKTSSIDNKKCMENGTIGWRNSFPQI